MESKLKPDKFINLVECVAEEQHQSPCKYGNIVDGHACYCHHPSEIARKCPIWRNYGEHDKSKWHNKSDFESDENWDGGCKYFRSQMEDKLKPCPYLNADFRDKKYRENCVVDFTSLSGGVHEDRCEHYKHPYGGCKKGYKS